MNLAIQFLLLNGAGEAVETSTMADNAAQLAAALADVGALEGRLVITFDGPNVCDPFADPIVRLVDSWLRKLPWIIGGDTETVALRNSEQCFAFVPAGDSVEMSYFIGSETEIEEYIFEPTTVRLEAFVKESLGLGERLLDFMARGDATALRLDEDLKDLQTSFDEAKRAWRDHLLHSRR